MFHGQGTEAGRGKLICTVCVRNLTQFRKKVSSPKLKHLPAMTPLPVTRRPERARLPWQHGLAFQRQPLLSPTQGLGAAALYLAVPFIFTAIIHRQILYEPADPTPPVHFKIALLSKRRQGVSRTGASPRRSWAFWG